MEPSSKKAKFVEEDGKNLLRASLPDDQNSPQSSVLPTSSHDADDSFSHLSASSHISTLSHTPSSSLVDDLSAPSLFSDVRVSSVGTDASIPTTGLSNSSTVSLPQCNQISLVSDISAPSLSLTLSRSSSNVSAPATSSALSRSSSNVSAPSPPSTVSRRLSSLPSPPPVNPREILPVEMWEHILSFLTLKDGLSAGRVCSLFHRCFVRKPLQVTAVRASTTMLGRREDHILLTFDEEYKFNTSNLVFRERHFRSPPLSAYFTPRDDTKGLRHSTSSIGSILVDYHEWHSLSDQRGYQWPIDNRCVSLAMVHAAVIKLEFPVASPPDWLGVHPHPPARMGIRMRGLPVMKVDCLRKWIQYCPPSIFHLEFFHDVPTPLHYLYPEEVYHDVLKIKELHSMEDVTINRFPHLITLGYEEVKVLKYSTHIGEFAKEVPEILHGVVLKFERRRISTEPQPFLSGNDCSNEGRSFKLFGVSLENGADLLRQRIVDWMVSVIVDEFTWTIAPQYLGLSPCFENMFHFNNDDYLTMHGCVIVMTKQTNGKKMLLILDKGNPSRRLILSAWTLRSRALDKEISIVEKYQRKHGIIE